MPPSQFLSLKHLPYQDLPRRWNQAPKELDHILHISYSKSIRRGYSLGIPVSGGCCESPGTTSRPSKGNTFLPGFLQFVVLLFLCKLLRVPNCTSPCALGIPVPKQDRDIFQFLTALNSFASISCPSSFSTLLIP